MMENQKSYEQLAELDKKHFLHPTTAIKQQQANGPEFILTKGEGVRLYDLKGRSSIDGLSSLWNVNIGHGREEIAQVAYEQMKTLGYSSCFATFSNEPAIKLAAKLAEIAPGNLTATFFTSGGSESNDTAYKLARHYWILKGQPERKKIISRSQSYHGVAMGATSATGLKPFRDFTNSLAPDFCYVDHFSPQALRDKIQEEGPETVAAYIAEPVQGAGGVHIAPEGYFKEIRSICDEFGILFITDEVITAFGRTGKYFGIDHYDVAPDMMCFAKGITSGYAQLGGVMISETMHNDFIELSEGTLLHGYTYSGHPMACAVALKNLEILERENLIDNARVMGEELLKGFKKIQSERSIVGDVRTLGLIGAVEIVKNKETNERFPEPLAPKVLAEAAKRGLIVRSVVFDNQDTLVFAPPLIINQQEINELIQILNESIEAVERTAFSASN
ncbi:aspartate aminotransferase family protein [Fictibacillus enclensis]|uniref:aminotransferase family protein n=1 Tax=Fictibacillus enclensis TaxID=1017270 RepID=UPI0025A137C0|nr:aspartate aminotransferase family protein [Fictibacillus enclensis]MDM5200866.1 aspartate aminotransferase family protein [Fictibacillus enclensis]